MGFYYRRSVGLGPFRISLSKSGVGYSLGGRGFRVGVDGRGRSYTNASLPGTGLGYRGKGCLPLLLGGFIASFAGIRLWQAIA